MIDYMIMEAVFLKIQKQDKDAEKERKIKDWKNQKKEELKKYT